MYKIIISLTVAVIVIVICNIVKKDKYNDYLGKIKCDNLVKSILFLILTLFLMVYILIWPFNPLTVYFLSAFLTKFLYFLVHNLLIYSNITDSKLFNKVMNTNNYPHDMKEYFKYADKIIYTYFFTSIFIIVFYKLIRYLFNISINMVLSIIIILILISFFTISYNLYKECEIKHNPNNKMYSLLAKTNIVSFDYVYLTFHSIRLFIKDMKKDKFVFWFHISYFIVGIVLYLACIYTSSLPTF